MVFPNEASALRLITAVLADKHEDWTRKKFIENQIPKLSTTDDALRAISIIIEAVGSGNITPNEGEALSRVIDAFVKAIQMHEIEKRVDMLEHDKIYGKKSKKA